VRIVRTVAEMHDARPPSGTVGLVPTMGSMHPGHLSLLEAARAECDFVVSSLFVNEAQFAAGEDFARYPRDEEHDVRIAERAGIDVLFAPGARELYPEGFQTWVDVVELAKPLEGEFRPGHFRGVATVCLKLFNIVRPHRAYFGQKDAQQVVVLRRMVSDLNVDLELRVLPTVRDTDGLAFSSRNANLTPQERERALTLPHALRTGDPIRARALLADEGIDTDYVDVLDDGGSRFLVGAVRVGSTRLIDNVPLEGENR
jgi:pantoate--beta-alanine ligase